MALWRQGALAHPDGTCSRQVLAFFRFSGLLLGYAVLRLRHWGVIAVRCPLRGAEHAAGGCWGWAPPQPHFPLALQVTTLVSSAFLIVKVILSEVSGWGLAGPGAISEERRLRLLLGWGVCESCPVVLLRYHSPLLP